MVFMGKKLTKEEIKCFKMTEREIFKKFGNLNEDKFKTKNNKSSYAKNTLMTNIIKHWRGLKKEE